MAHIELYVIESAEQVESVENSYLVEFLHDAQCENCDVIVGYYDSPKFFPCVICIDGEDEVWVVCVECAGGVIYPGE